MIEFSQIWLVSFGARWNPGEGWHPSFLAARELISQRNIALEQTALFTMPAPPYQTTGTSLFICFVGEALAGCHIWLGWPPPTRLIDLHVEFRNLANGQSKPCGDGLIGAMVWFGLPVSGISFSSKSICDGARDLDAIERLLILMKPGLDLRLAILRGRYLVAVARIEATGIPVDFSKQMALKRHWRNVQRSVGRTIAEVKPGLLAVGQDGRQRARIRPFSSRPGRNQPSTTEFLMAASGWVRRLIQPEAGKSIALVDWSQQEFGIAAALSGDERMMADYRGGDPYQAMAERYGGDRAVFKACALGVLNGIGTSGLARSIGRGASEARLLLQEHRAEYPAFWRWSDGVESHAFLHGRLQSTFGWHIAVNADTNPRFLRNYPLQANGAEMLRLACCFATERGVTVCAPNHDALLIEAPLDELSDAVEVARDAMAEASKIVLDGFPLRTSVTTIRHPDHYPHPKSTVLWSDIERCLADLGDHSEPVHERDASCALPNPRPISLYVLNRKGQSDDLD